MGKNSWKDRSEKIDEHNLPTEPLPPLVLSAPHAPIVLPAIPGAQPYEYTYPQPYMPTTPIAPPYPASSQPYEHAYPQPYMPTTPAAPPYPYSQSPALPGTYPFLPLAPVNPSGRKGQSPVQSAKPTASSPRTHNRAIPFCVGFCFVILQLLLLVRFCSRLINLPTSLSWVGPLYAISEVFVAPFRSLVQPYIGGVPASIELYTLLAVLVYGLGSRLLVRCLKAFL